jgi:hypothetical protein
VTYLTQQNVSKISVFMSTINGGGGGGGANATAPFFYDVFRDFLSGNPPRRKTDDDHDVAAPPLLFKVRALTFPATPSHDDGRLLLAAGASIRATPPHRHHQRHQQPTTKPLVSTSTGTCTRALVAVCESARPQQHNASGTMKCDVCVSAHAAALRGAGCSAGDVQAWCTGGSLEPGSGGEPIDARKDFGCKGDGVADDTACLQAALDAGGIQRRRVHIPGGVYLVSSSLLIKGSNSSMYNESYNHEPIAGDGKTSTTIQAINNSNWGPTSNNLAVIFFPTCCGALPQSGAGFHLSDITVDANLVADYGILAPAVQESLFQRLYIVNALVAGMHIGWGWCNRVEDCEFELNYIGLVLTNANNNVNVINSLMVDNEVGMYIGSGLQLNIEGNTFEGNGGPGCVVFGARGLTMNSNCEHKHTYKHCPLNRVLTCLSRTYVRTQTSRGTTARKSKWMDIRSR